MGAPKVEAPKPRDYAQEMKDALNAQIELQPKLLASEKEYQPQYQLLQQQMMDKQLQFQGESYAKYMPQAAALSSQYANVMAPVYGQIGEQSMQAYRQGLGSATMGLYDIMNKQAMEGLQAGSGLTAQMTQQSQQAARAAMAARGLTGNQAVAQEVLGGYNMGLAREDRARQYAGQMYTQGQQNFQQAMGTYGNQMLSQANAYAPANMYGTAYNMSQGLGAQIFQPESQYNAQLITANRKEAMDAQIANAQSSSALTSGLLGATGSIVGGMATGGVGFFAPAACWVAREVYGVENPKWLLFREWLETKAPEWFHKLYLEEGERFAEYIKDKPLLKSVIRLAMDCVIKLNFNSNQITV
jgi:hypothetical protein